LGMRIRIISIASRVDRQKQPSINKKNDIEKAMMK
jgi:hypothetical protein